MSVLMKSRTSSKMGHAGSKTRSLCQILEKHCVRSRGHIFSLIIMKLGQNVCLDKSRTGSKMGHVGSKNRSLGQIFFFFRILLATSTGMMGVMPISHHTLQINVSSFLNNLLVLLNKGCFICLTKIVFFVKLFHHLNVAL